ncbi:MAG: Gfo/Idh/MocA family oxidoreductase [Dehalococcoidia bacterium]|nr:Gfo/Idh/MocA family oxidoreductase [Dehalococcoidia bacterium]
MTQTAAGPTPTTSYPRRLRIGIAGIGQGGGGMLPLMATMPQLQLVAGADTNPVTRERFMQRYPDTRVYDSVAALCADSTVEAVWVSSPNRFHCEHAIEALRAGKHVVVEKPMAISLEEADRMVEAAGKSGTVLIAGHTNSFELPIRAMRKVINSGLIGRLRAVHVWSYTDWMLRARTPDELDPTQGGGIPWRQGPHQIDVVRVLGGGLLRSVRAMTGAWMRERPIAGYYNAFLEFEDGTPATVLHNGYGYFRTGELFPWAREGLRSSQELSTIRKSMRAGTRDEQADKQEFRIGGSRDPNRRTSEAPAGPKPWTPSDLGMVLATCERGDIRNSPFGLYVYTDDGPMEITLPIPEGGAVVEHRGELEELYDAAVLGRPAYHSGVWGAATLEACIAMMQSARERREIMLQRQIAMPPDYDAALELPPPHPVATE